MVGRDDWSKFWRKMVGRDAGSKWCGPNFCKFLRIFIFPRFFWTYLIILYVNSVHTISTQHLDPPFFFKNSTNHLDQPFRPIISTHHFDPSPSAIFLRRAKFHQSLILFPSSLISTHHFDPSPSAIFLRKMVGRDGGSKWWLIFFCTILRIHFFCFSTKYTFWIFLYVLKKWWVEMVWTEFL